MIDKTPPTDPVAERQEVMDEFTKMLWTVTGDGSRKRQAGQKPSWKVDETHMPALFSHLNRYFHGERKDPDSGQHPLVHLAWRALAQAWQDTHPRKSNAHIKPWDLPPSNDMHRW